MGHTNFVCVSLSLDVTVRPYIDIDILFIGTFVVHSLCTTQGLFVRSRNKANTLGAHTGLIPTMSPLD